jgi:TonB family protein
MSTGTAPAFQPPATTRRAPRYKLAVPLDLTVLRSGVPDRITGHTVELGEGGLGVRTAEQLVVGESVRVEFLVPHMNVPVRATAVVRYQHRNQCFGLQFLRLPADQQSIIRYWTRREGDLLLGTPAARMLKQQVAPPASLANYAASAKQDAIPSGRRIAGFIAVLVLTGAVLLWWRWQQGWNELETQGPGARLASAVRPQLTLPAEEMERRIVHKFLPEYPQPAKSAGIQGKVVLDAVVGPQGNIEQLRLVSGPGALAQAAMDAVRWWRYQPYLANGQPVAVETTVELDFRLAN